MKPILKAIRLIDIQSHKDVMIKLSPGLNVFSGKSNSGKSIIFKVMRKMVMPNFWGVGANSQLIRQGCECGVVIFLMSDNKMIKFVIHPTYQTFSLIENKVVVKSWQGEMPDELKEYLGWYVDSENKYLLNLIDQQIQLPFVDSSDTFNESVLRCVTQHEDLDNSKINLKESVDIIRDRISKCRVREDVLLSALSVSLVVDIDVLESKVDRMDLLISALSKVEDIVGLNIQEFKKPEEVYIDSDLEHVVSAYLKSETISDRYTELLSLEKPEDVIIHNDLGVVVDCIKSISVINNELGKLRSLDKPEVVFVDDKLSSVVDLVNKFNQINFNIANYNSSLYNARMIFDQYRNTERRIKLLEKELGVCPLCKKSFGGVE